MAAKPKKLTASKVDRVSVRGLEPEVGSVVTVMMRFDKPYIEQKPSGFFVHNGAFMFGQVSAVSPTHLEVQTVPHTGNPPLLHGVLLRLPRNAQPDATYRSAALRLEGLWMVMDLSHPGRAHEDDNVLIGARKLSKVEYPSFGIHPMPRPEKPGIKGAR